MTYIEFFFRYFHVLAGIVWIGMLYYFNFVQTEYFKEAEASAKSDAMAKLAPRALWWFRWGAMLTFLTGAYLFQKVGAFGMTMPAIWVGALAGTFMFLNVWLVIWPNQQIVLGMKEGDPLPFDVARIDAGAMVGEVVMKTEYTPLLQAALAKGCGVQVGTDMLFEMIPAYLEFFGYGTATADELRAVAQIKY